ncbi:MAG: hypothetical protein USCGTAYLOR_02628 [Chromatiales bacterium USCg_Taylor]|nr:MAG: hypothetical protein USCGTAYLOR_02628 [Chromatiales bacterium USCg_Taylor]
MELPLKHASLHWPATWKARILRLPAAFMPLHPRRTQQGRLRPRPASLALGYSPLAMAFRRLAVLAQAGERDGAKSRTDAARCDARWRVPLLLPAPSSAGRGKRGPSSSGGSGSRSSRDWFRIDRPLFARWWLGRPCGIPRRLAKVGAGWDRTDPVGGVRCKGDRLWLHAQKRRQLRCMRWQSGTRCARLHQALIRFPQLKRPAGAPDRPLNNGRVPRGAPAPRLGAWVLAFGAPLVMASHAGRATRDRRRRGLLNGSHCVRALV